jgi:hypothetical protein
MDAPHKAGHDAHGRDFFSPDGLAGGEGKEPQLSEIALFKELFK